MFLIAVASLGATLPAVREAMAAGSTMLGGFQPIAVETGARAAWVCPAAISFYGNSQLVAEGVFLEQREDFSELSLLTLAAGTEGRAFGWQLELDDTPGVPDWTIALAQTLGRGRRVKLGTFAEVRGGDGTKFDAGLSAFAPVGRMLHVAFAVEDLLANDVDGAEGARRLRGGVAARGPHLWLSWDWRGVEHETARHFFGLGIDARYVRLEGILDDDDGWTVEARLVFDRNVLGAGVTEPETGSGSRFATIEAGSPVQRVR
jgi:hypothetical protein